MCLPYRLELVVLLGALAMSAGAQSRPPQHERTRFIAADTSLDSTSIQIKVMDHRTKKELPALICVGRLARSEVVTDTRGAVRISNLRQTNVPVRVVAQGYDVETLIFFPGRRGRSQAVVHLVPNAALTRAPNCAALPPYPA